MPKKQNPKGGDFFIVDNSDEQWKTVNCLREWTKIAIKLDITTGYFKIGSQTL